MIRLLIIVSLIATPAFAGPRVSHDMVRAAVERGEILPLDEIQQKIKDHLPGLVVKVEIEQKGGQWIYEFKTLDAAGRRHDVYVDGKAGEILEIEHK